MIWITIGLMSLIIFISRYLFLEPKLPLKLNKHALHFLSYAAPAVLTAIIAPMVLVKEHSLYLIIVNT